VKLGISIFLFLSTPVLSAMTPVQLYFEEGQRLEAIIYRDLLIQDYAVPEELITLTEVMKCETMSAKTEFELCIKSNGDLKVVSVDKKFIQESLSIFKAP
jgi:hypothetical protein